MIFSKQWNGFTLVEIVVTLSLLALILIMSMPFTTAWINNAKVSETETVLQQAVAMARAQAVNSPRDQLAQQAPVAVVCINDRDLEVRVVNLNIDLNAGEKPCVSSKIVWRAKLTEQVISRYLDENDEPKLLSEMYFDSEGNLAAQYCMHAIDRDRCATSNTLLVSAEGAADKKFSAL
jgi:prepilin-type N-terminal cleavage/methylation domain-containing protein